MNPCADADRGGWGAGFAEVQAPIGQLLPRRGRLSAAVAIGVLSMCDDDGKPTGKPHRLGADEDPRALAARVKRAEIEPRGSFNRRLDYQPWGLA
jgi:hypothetical protein